MITSWNGGAERLFGYPRRRGDRPVDHADHPAGTPFRGRRRASGTIRAGRRVEPFETVRRRKDGSDVDVSITVSPIVDGSGAIVGASKIARDITRAAADRADARRPGRAAARGQREARGRRAIGWPFSRKSASLLASSLDYEETLDRAVHLALPRLGDYCNVLIQDEHGQLRQAAWGHVVASKEPLLRELAQLVFESPQAPQVPTFADRVMASGQTIVIDATTR